MSSEFLVCNSHGHDIWAFGTPDYGLMRKMDVGGHPDEIKILEPDSTALISRRHNDDLLAMDYRTGEHLWRVPTSGNPHHITLARDGELVYTPLFNSQQMEVISVADRRVVARIDVGWGGHGAFTSASGERVYVGSCFEDKISVIDVASNQVERELLFGEGVRPFVITSDESRLYVQQSKMHGFVVYDLYSDRVTATVPLPDPPQGNGPWLRFPHTVNHGMGLTADERHLIVAASSTRTVYVYAVPELVVVAEIEVGEEPNWVTFDKEGSVAHISNRADNTISIIDTGRWVELRRLPVGDYPQRMAVV